MTSPSRKIRENDSQIGRSYSENYCIFCQYRSKLAITPTIAIKWKEKYDAVVVDCPKKKFPWVPFRTKFQFLGRLFRPSLFPANNENLPSITPTKRLNAQHMVEYKKQLLYEENRKTGNVMQQPMDSCICGINTSSESILIRSYLLFGR